MKAFEKAKRPLTADEILSLAKEEVPSLGMRTVYRHIKAMEEGDQMISLDYPGQPVHYEIVDGRGSRPHFICKTCRKLYDLEIPEPRVRMPNVEGFEFEGHEVIFFGKCPTCAG